MSEKGVIAIAQSAVGDSDTIVAAAWVEPRGMAGGFIGGSELGGDLGNMAGGGIGGAVGSVAGAMIGMHETHKQGGIAPTDHPEAQMAKTPQVALLAVSATRLRCWRPHFKGGHRVAGEVVFDLDRSTTTVTVHGRLTVRTFTVVDTSTNRRWEFESNRLGGHGKYVANALKP